MYNFLRPSLPKISSSCITVFNTILKLNGVRVLSSEWELVTKTKKIVFSKIQNQDNDEICAIHKKFVLHTTVTGEYNLSAVERLWKRIVVRRRPENTEKQEVGFYYTIMRSLSQLNAVVRQLLVKKQACSFLLLFIITHSIYLNVIVFYFQN